MDTYYQVTPQALVGALAGYGSLDPFTGHKPSFVTSVATLLEYILELLLIPRWLLSKLN